MFLKKNKKRNQKTIAFGHCSVCNKNFIDIESHKKIHSNEAKDDFNSTNSVTLKVNKTNLTKERPFSVIYSF